MTRNTADERSRTSKAAVRVLALPVFGSPFRLDWSFDLRGWIADCIAEEIEQRRLFSWGCVCFGLGIALFFQADGRPALWAPGLGLALCMAGAFRLRHHLAGSAACIALAAVFAGFGAGALRVRSVDEPVLARTTITTLAGFIETVDDRPEGKRVLLRVLSLQGIPDAQKPYEVRVSTRKAEGLAPGRFMEATARLLPPPQPAWPGGYDFARDAFYRRIGAVGSLTGSIRFPPPPRDPPWDLQLSAFIDTMRGVLTDRIASSIGGQAGAVGAALITGKRGLIDETTNDILRGAGIYHIVSISGLHMVLAAGTFFWLSRALLALVPALVLFWPVKKITAGVAMAGAVLYCVFSGADVASERSLIMTLVMFGAILVDRPALSIRNLAVSALIVLAREPEALLGPSFQMSFGAVAALIAGAPLLRLKSEEKSPWLPYKIARWAAGSLLGLVGTTVIASIATAPFTAYHFQTINPLGLIGNALALPLVSAVVMPCAVVGVLAYPFGLDRLIWQVMGLAVSKVLDVSAWVNGLEGSTVLVPAMGTGALLAFSAALLTATLFVSPLRRFAILPMAIGLALAAVPERFDMFIDREGAGAMVRGDDGRLVLLGKPSRFVVEEWLRADGDPRDAQDASLRQGSRCDRLGCVVERRDGRHVAFDSDILALEEDCRRASVVLTRIKPSAGCAAPLVLDKTTLEAQGATALRFADEGIVLHSVRHGRETRSWLKPASVQMPSTETEMALSTRPVPGQDLPEPDPVPEEPDQ